jgi:hypothetical protein
MPSRRQLLSLGISAAALAGLAALRVRAQAPDTILYMPLTAGPLPTPEPTATPEPTPGPNDAGWIIAAASGTAEQAIAWCAARAVGYTLFDITSIVQVYQSLGETGGVDWFLALAQCAHETGGMSSWWSQRPRRNPAGIGVTGKMLVGAAESPPGADWAWDEALGKWREGVSFASWAEEAIPAQLGRLLAYALPDGAGTSAQQALIAYALSRRPLPAEYRGIAPLVTGLNGRWAYPGTTYGESILDLARRMRGGL